MKTLLLSACLACCGMMAKATNYYISSSIGDDSRTAAQASNPATPWKSIAKLNAVFATLQPGDNIYFKRGEVFYGNIKVAKSGTTTAPILIGAYGTGNNPEITGFNNVAGWVNMGNGIYESTNAVSTLAALNSVVINNATAGMGRFPNVDAPNGGYLNFEATSGNTNITDNELTTATNWTGAELVVRTNRFVIDRTKITNHSGGTLTYSPALSYNPLVKFGYFFQNSLKTLDKVGEWYYNPSTKKISVFFGAEGPSGYTVRATSTEEVVTVFNQDNIVVENLDITGANGDGIDIYSADNVVVRNSAVKFAGVNGINVANSNRLRVLNNQIFECHSTAVNLGGGNADALVKDNFINRTALVIGMGPSGANKSIAIKVVGERNVIQNNRIENTGYIGISFGGNYTEIRNNVVINFNSIKDDGGGIYTVNSDRSTKVGRKVIGNIVMNGIGAAFGTNYSNAKSTSGIYLDDFTNAVELIGNTTTNCTKAGIYIHNSRNIVLRNNLSFDNLNQLSMTHDPIGPDWPLRNLTIVGNQFIAKKASQTIINVSTIKDDIAQMGTIDSNYYSRPLDNGYFLQTMHTLSTGKKISQYMNLSMWQKAWGLDRNTKISAVTIQPFKLNSLISGNLYGNGEFNTSISGPSVNTNATSFTKTWVNGALNGGTFQGSVSGTTPSNYTLAGKLGTLTAGKKYYVTFTAKSNLDTGIAIYFRKSASPYTVLSNDGAKTMVQASSNANKFEFAFVPKETQPDGVLLMDIGGVKNTFHYDDIKVHEANLDITNPDDSIRFVYNGSTAATSISLDAEYADITGRTYSGIISLQPYASMVLIRKGDALLAAATAPAPAPTPTAVAITNQAPAVTLTSPKASATFGAPATVRLTATATDADGTISKVEFWNGSKLIKTEYTAPYDWSWTNVPAGTYTITAKAYDNKGASKVSSAATITVKSATAAIESNGNMVSMLPEAQMGAAELKVYPNPAVNNLYVSFGKLQGAQKGEVVIRNVAGAQVKRMQMSLDASGTQVDVSSLPTGMYILSVYSEKGKAEQKFIKQAN